MMSQLVLDRNARLLLQAKAHHLDPVVLLGGNGLTEAVIKEVALDFAKENLKKNGSFVGKVFQGSGYSQYVEACKKTFRKVSVRKPEASRSSSAEVYIVARDLK